VSARLAAALRAEGGLLADAVRDDAADEDGELARTAAAGPRNAGRAHDIALLVEAIEEGSLLHYGAARTVSQVDPDLALLAGDRLYALGLDRLAQLGDLEAVAALAEVIAACAEAHAAGAPHRAAAAWRAGARTVAGAQTGRGDESSSGR